ncbi:hypothetical protein JCM14469_11860 [Desulfatiferula olefinivorans]
MTSHSPIAVVGMAGVFPGANDIDTFWSHIEGGICAIGEVPEDRWILNPARTVAQTVAPDRTLSRKAGLIRNFHFDAEGFALSPGLLSELDPMYHLALTAGRDALRSVRTTDDLRKRCGVILAAIALPTDAASRVTREILGKTVEASMFGDDILHTMAPLSPAQCLASRVTALPGALLARGLDLGGGSYTLDAACASSLYAIKLACDELASGRADMMLAGGVSRPESLFTQAGFTQLKALSPSGVCAPFDASADGLVVGEGAGIIVLKRLDDALRDKDTIHALIHGAGLTNDIGGNLLAPDTEGQVRAMRLAYATTGWSPVDVDHIECHGTGTPVGDAIELKSLRAVWGSSGWTRNQCAIGSVKSMIGHLLTGAGIAGALKSILSLTRKTLPPSLNFKAPASGSPLIDGPFTVLSQAAPWPRPAHRPRRAAVSAFGFGGTNAHVLMEEWEPTRAKTYAVPAMPDPKRPDVAIVGLGAVFGPTDDLSGFQDLIFDARPMTGSPAPAERLRGTDRAALVHLAGTPLPRGNYLNGLTVSIGEFHIPPNEFADILPQHLLMLKAAARAMDDAGLARREDRPRMGTAIGMNQDFEAANFHLRWNLENQVSSWNRDYGLGLSPDQEQVWLSDLKKQVQPPLTAARTTGALGGIIASRVAKEFRLGGPSFIVSGEDTSGLKALAVGLRAIQNNEADLFLAGAVDLPGEIRNLVTMRHQRSWSHSDTITPFDPASPGTLPGEGAVAVVLKRLDQARTDGDRIYAVIKGVGGAVAGPDHLADAYAASLDRTFTDARLTPSAIGYIECHAGGFVPEDSAEARAVSDCFSGVSGPVALGCTSPVTGQTGAASGLTALIKTCLCVYQRTIPPFGPHGLSGGSPFDIRTFNAPAAKKAWDTPVRRALLGSISPDGNVCHVIIENAPDEDAHTKPGTAPLKPVSAMTRKPGAKTVTLPVCGPPLSGVLPEGVRPIRPGRPVITPACSGQTDAIDHDFFGQTLRSFEDTIAQTARAHTRYLEFSQTMTRAFADALDFQSDLIGRAVSAGDPALADALVIDRPFACDPKTPPVARHIPQTPAPLTIPVEPVFEPKAPPRPEPTFPRDMCMEFAIGSIGKVLGPMFDEVDTYKVRVRLPDEPLMLVDRIMSVTGEKGSLGSGTVVTEHDVLPGAWYLDGGRCPVCISIEAGQADLFLCSYLGIDLAVKGKRSYRLLDAVAEFHSGLPKPGDTIRYVIDIDRFIHQGETYLFFFRFNGYIGDRHIISMRNGCAGFFTEKEVKDSGGIILTAEETARVPGVLAADWKDLTSFFHSGETYSLTDNQVDALRRGDAEGAFGPLFKSRRISPSMVIPGGRMKLVDRVLEIDPAGGRYGLGSIRAQADIHPDDWFLTCHFVDDMVMPGTLMYECCMHTLRIFTMRMGWITDLTDVVCEPIPNVKSVLKCRGPVTVATKHVFYQVDIKEIGYNPEPYVLADAHMFAHDQHIVMFRDMSMKLSGVTRSDIERYWGIA